jgi:exonuclease SbcC
MSAFGPYKGMVTIDFTVFENHLFLITGPTGSGKTTIFDAISYALYGDPTGEYRDNSFLRSSYSNPSVKTYVEFTFDYQGKTYTIKRFPAQERKALRKGKDSEQNITDPESVSLEGPDFKPLSKTKEVNAKIIEIVGLGKNQFEETVMIAQGDFNKLINASTKDRCAIFRKILKTDDLNQFKENLKKKDSETTDRVKQQNTQMLGSLQAYQTEDVGLKARIASKTAIDELEELIRLAQSDNDAVSERLSFLQKDSETKEQQKNQLIKERETAAAFNKDKEDFFQAASRLQELLKEKVGIEEIREKIKKARRAKEVIGAYRPVLDAKEELAQNQKEREDNKKKLPLALAAWEKAKKSHDEGAPILDKEGKALAQESSELSGKIKLFQQLEIAQKEQQTALEKVRQTQIDFNFAFQKKKKAEDDIVFIRHSYEHYDASIRRDSCLRQLEDLKKEDKKLVDFQIRFSSYQVLLASLEEATKKYSQAKGRFDEANGAFERAFELFQDGQAGLIASSLAEGKACPVCGATHHPQLAKSELKAPTQDQVMDLEKKQQKAQDDVAQKSTDIQNINIKAETILAQLKKDYFETFSKELILASFSTDILFLLEQHGGKTQKAQVVCDGLDFEIQKHDEAFDRLAIEEKQLSEALAPSLEITRTHLDQLQQDEARKEQTVVILFKQVENLSQDTIQARLAEIVLRQNVIIQEKAALTLASEKGQAFYQQEVTHQKDNETTIQKLQERLVLLEIVLVKALSENGFTSVEEATGFALPDSTIDKYQKKVENFDCELASSNALFESSLKKGCDIHEKIDLAALDFALNAAKDVAEMATNCYHQIRDHVSANVLVLSQIRTIQKNTKIDLEFAKDMRQLYNTATGQLNGVGHIDFEVYYQSQIFDDILFSASKKLNDMTDGRFLFARRKEPLSGVGLFGLDIDVIDNNSGKERPVSTLSGGESFMASLSLALSLSEIIQQKAGGIELDSMFVDEGFGTLDPESLDNAIRILTNLSNSGHRLVGIISHVDTLQSSIPLQIIVSKGQEGSTLKIKI